MAKYLKGTAPSTQYDGESITPLWNFDTQVSGWCGVWPVIELDEVTGAMLIAAGGILKQDEAPVNLHERA